MQSYKLAILELSLQRSAHVSILSPAAQKKTYLSRPSKQSFQHPTPIITAVYRGLPTYLGSPYYKSVPSKRGTAHPAWLAPGHQGNATRCGSGCQNAAHFQRETCGSSGRLRAHGESGSARLWLRGERLGQQRLRRLELRLGRYTD